MLNKIKKKVRVLFQMDPLDKLNIKSDSTISIIKEAFKRDLDVWVASPEKLTIKKSCVFLMCQKINEISPQITLNESQPFNANEFDFFFIRQDPPFDMNYLTNCYLLELHQEFNKRPHFINCPRGIKNFTEKIFPIYFSDLMPKTLITSDEKVFKEALANKQILILKTLYNKGGEGVIKVEKKDKNSLKKFKELIENYKVPVVIQDFISKVSEGDKRVILIEGEAVGLINRIPKSGNYKANLHLGAKAEVSKLTKKELEICRKIKPFLLKNKLFFVGIDLIDEKLTEINVTSPTGIVQIQQLTGVNIAKRLWDKLLKN